MVSFTFKGAEVTGVAAQRHMNEHVPRVFALLCTHTMGPFIALACAAMSHESAVSESVLDGGKDQGLQELCLLTSWVTLSESWNCFGLSIPVCKVGIMLTPCLAELL